MKMFAMPLSLPITLSHTHQEQTELPIYIGLHIKIFVTATTPDISTFGLFIIFREPECPLCIPRTA